jgi:3-oxoacyl-(acyl-carrier-protein) synthase
MQRAIADAGIAADTIDYINAHGTATPFNDACEARAIADVCPSAKVSSTKGQMGHSLGAAGAIEAAVCVIAMQNQFLPANLHFRQGDPDTSLDVIAGQALPASPKRVMSNSLGFGGANASIILEAGPS